MHAELLDTDTELVPEDSAVVESETDALHIDTSIPVTPIPAIDVASLAPEVQEDTTVMPESESDLPIKTEGSSPVKDEDAIQDSSPSKSFVDTKVQREAQELEDTFNTEKPDPGIADVNILPEILSPTVTLSFFES